MMRRNIIGFVLLIGSAVYEVVGSTDVVHDNRYDLPELTNGQITGLIGDSPLEVGRLFSSSFSQRAKRSVQQNCNDTDKQRYRTIDGSCNNVQNPDWGTPSQPFKRLLPAQYENGSLPRTKDSKGNPLPSPRFISTTVSPMENHTANVTDMVMAWGQFIAHDITGTPVTKDGGRKIKCCGEIAENLTVENGGPCFAIEIPSGDPLGRDCMEFVRSLPYTFPNGTQGAAREQINILTSFLDASAVYGNTQDHLNKLKGANGTLRVTKKNMLPEDTSASCKKERKGDYCLLAGDFRVNVFMTLGALHTTFVREHNRLVEALRALNNSWDDDTLFQEARRIVSAEFQHVTYHEWLPVVLDDATLSRYNLTDKQFKYDRKTNPFLSNVFATAAFRFGHSQIKQQVKLRKESLPVQDTFMRPRYTLTHMDRIFNAFTSVRTDEVDRFFSNGVTNHLFETNSTAGDGMDLVSLNIQRGRDHGLPPFNDWREYYGLPRITDFGSSELSTNLSNAYSDMDDVDVYVGLMVETHASDSLVGPTLANLLGSQFRDIKFGDRFFYESKRQSGSFTKAQLKEIKKVTLAKIICDNNPEIKKMQKNVFMITNKDTNRRKTCSKIQGMNLDKWTE